MPPLPPTLRNLLARDHPAGPPHWRGWRPPSAPITRRRSREAVRIDVPPGQVTPQPPSDARPASRGPARSERAHPEAGPSHPRSRLRALAPDALRPFSGRERTSQRRGARCPPVAGRLPGIGRRRGCGSLGVRGAVRGTNAPADFPPGRSGAGTLPPPGDAARTRTAAG